MSKFKGCPFCGGQPKTTIMGPDNEWKCGNKDCPIYGIKMHSSAWNTRQPDTELVAALEKISNIEIPRQDDPSGVACEFYNIAVEALAQHKEKP